MHVDTASMYVTVCTSGGQTVNVQVSTSYNAGKSVSLDLKIPHAIEKFSIKVTTQHF